MPDYSPSDFTPPLSDDAVILLSFVQEKKRVIARLRRRMSGVFAAGFVLGVAAVAILQSFA